MTSGVDRRPDTLIQRPDIIHRLQQFLGLRQLPVVPHLREGVQAVVIMGDVREVPTEKVIERPCMGFVRVQNFTPANHLFVALSNNVGSGVVIRVHEIDVGPARWTMNLGSGHLGSGESTSFRDQPRVPFGPVTQGKPRGDLFADISAAAPVAQYSLPPNPATRGDWGVGWRIPEGTHLRLDSDDATGAGVFEAVGILWTESRRDAS